MDSNSTKLHSKKIYNCQKVFDLMGLLSDDGATFKDIVELLSRDKNITSLSDDTTVYSVELGKYLNTMELFGFKTTKEKGCYRLERNPFKINVNIQDIEAFELIKKFASSLAINTDKNSENDTTNGEINKFIRDMETRFPDNVSMLQKRKESKDELDFSFYFAELADKIIVCRKCCQEEYNVKISYYDDKEIKTIIARANEIIYRKRIVWLKVTETQNNKRIVIALDKIIGIKQQPSKSGFYGSGQTSVFILRGRLSKNYTIRSWERTLGLDENDCLTVINEKEPSNELINRLISYGENCKIKSPAILKQEYLNQVESILALYQDT